jgi:hypothetical protein
MLELREIKSLLPEGLSPDLCDRERKLRLIDLKLDFHLYIKSKTFGSLKLTFS